MAKASPWLRTVIFGGSLHPDVLYATQMVGTFVRKRLRPGGQLEWSEVVGLGCGRLMSLGSCWICCR